MSQLKFWLISKLYPPISKTIISGFFGLAAGINISLPLTSIITIFSLSIAFSLLQTCKNVLEQSFLIFVWSFGFLVAGTFWIVIAIYDPVLTPLSTACFVAATLYITHALIYATTYFIAFKSLSPINAITTQRFKNKFLNKTSVIAFSLIISLTISEIIRAQGFWAMPMGMIGYTQTSNPLIVGIYPVLGAYGVTSVTALLSILLILVYKSLKNQLLNKLTNNFSTYFATRYIYIFIILVFATLLFSTQFIEWNQASTQKLLVRVVHTHIPNIKKYDVEEQERSLKKIITLSSLDDVNLTLYPELYLVKPAHGIDKQSRKTIVESVIASKNAQFFGVPDNEISANGDILGSLNVMLQINELGQTKRYAKEILLPFSEFMPTHALVKWAMPYIFKFPLANFNSGIYNNTIPLQVKNINLAISLCNEIAYADNIHKHASKAQVLINSASDSWIPNQLYTMHSWQINKVRALEAQKPMLRSNNTGYSGFIDAWGNDKLMEYGVESTEKYEITPRIGNTPYTTMISFFN
jgi:apolipoprotein N-acyltransferase